MDKEVYNKIKLKFQYELKELSTLVDTVKEPKNGPDLVIKEVQSTFEEAYKYLQEKMDKSNE